MKKVIALLLCVAMVFAMGACAKPAGDEPSQGTESNKPSESADNEGTLAKEDLKIGLIYIGDPSDMGYTHAHENGRLYMKEKLGLSDDQMIVKANVSEDSACEDAINELIESGCNIIFGNSFGFGEFMKEAAEEHPEIYFLHATGIYSNDTNLANYFGRVYQPRYLAGIAAAMKSESGKLGYVAAFSNSECNSGINAFTLGAQTVNPDIEVLVSYTNSWDNPTGERQAAEALLDAGCDVIAQHVDSTAPQVAAQERGKWGVGYNSVMTEAAPDAELTSVIWNWGPVMTELVNEIMDGSFKGGINLGSMKIGTCELADLTKNVAPGTEEAVKKAYDKIVDDADEFDVFNGPICDNEGNLQIKEGEKADDLLIAQNMTWLVKGVTVK